MRLLCEVPLVIMYNMIVKACHSVQFCCKLTDVNTKKATQASQANLRYSSLDGYFLWRLDLLIPRCTGH